MAQQLQELLELFGSGSMDEMLASVGGITLIGPFSEAIACRRRPRSAATLAETASIRCIVILLRKGPCRRIILVR